MSLIRPKPRRADEVSDAFEQLFSASPMSKLLSVEQGYSLNTSSLSVVTQSPFKHPAMVTPVAKIFLKLKRSEGRLSVDSDAVNRRGNRQFSTSAADNDSSRLSFKQQQQREPLHLSTNGSYMNCKQRLGTATGSEFMVLKYPRVCLVRLDESLYKPKGAVVRGQESVHSSEEENKAEPRKQTGTYPQEDNVPRVVRKRKRRRTRKRNRTFAPEESESSDTESERRQREPRRRRHHLKEGMDDARDNAVHRDSPEREQNGSGSKNADGENDGRMPKSRRRNYLEDDAKHNTVSRDEQGENGCESNSPDAENERRPKSRRGRHHLEDKIDDAKDNAVDRDSDEPWRNHCESSDAENESRRIPRTSRRHLKERPDNTTDNVAASRRSDERGVTGGESSDTENEGRRRAPSRRSHRLDERRDDGKDNASEEQEENTRDENTDSVEGQRWQSQENERCDEFETGAHMDHGLHLTGDDPEMQDTKTRDMHNSDHRKDSDRTVSEEEKAQSRSSEEDWECNDTTRVRRTSRRDPASIGVTHSQPATSDENTSNTEPVRKGTAEQVAGSFRKTSHLRKLRSSHHTHYEPKDDDKNANRNARSFPQEKDSIHVQSTLVHSTRNEESSRPDKERATEMTVAVSCATPPFRRVTRVLSASRRLGMQEKSRKFEDHIHAKTASVEKPRRVDQKEVKKTTTAAGDLIDTPVNSRKLLKVTSAIRQHTLDNWTILPLGRNIYVDGHRPDDPVNQFWHSNAIVKRISSHAVATVSGTVYTLRGKMEEEKALLEGFSKKVIAAFKKGFPPTWKEIIQEHNEGSRRGSRSSKPRPSELKTPVQLHKTKPQKHLKRFRRASVMATSETPVTISSLPKTRSGRHVIPQLAWWTGQRVMIDPNNYTVDIAPGTPDTQCPIVSSTSKRWRTGPKAGKVTGPRRRCGKNDKYSKKIRQDVNTDGRKEGAPARKPLQHQKENSDARNSETETSHNTPIQRLFSGRTDEINSRKIADVDGTDDEESVELTDAVTRKQRPSVDLVKTLRLLERHERTGTTVREAEVQPVRREDSLSDDAGSCRSDSANNSRGHDKKRTNNPTSRPGYCNGVTNASDKNTGESSDKNKQASLRCVTNLSRDILRIVKTSRTSARQRRAGKALPCFSPRHDSAAAADSASSKSDDEATETRNLGAGRERHNRRSKLTVLGRTPRPRDDMLSKRRHGTETRHAGDMMPPLDFLLTEERVNRRYASPDAPKTPASRFSDNTTDDILCRSIEHKRLFSGKEVGVQRHCDKPRGKTTGRSDKSKAVHSNKDPCAKERSITKKYVAKQKKKKIRRREKNGKFYSPKRKDTLAGRKKDQDSDDGREEQTTIQREMLSRQKTSKAPEKTKRKTAAAPSHKPEKLPGKFAGGVGTLKRKRQLREFVEQHECGYENDLFDSTPFQHRKVRKVITQDAFDDFGDVTAGRMSFTTPGHTPSDSLRIRSAWLPTSDKKTPSSSMVATTPMSEAVNRNAVDRYMNRLKRVAKRRGTKLASGAAVATGKGVSRPLRQTSQSLTSVSPSIFHMANRTGGADSSNADDYYFSDGSDST